MTWEDFVAAVELYKREFSTRDGEDFAYVRCLRLLESKTIIERAANSRDITRFLNDWRCGVNKDNTPPMLAAWIRTNAERIEPLVHLSIGSPELQDCLGDIQAIYDDLWTRARAVIRTWGPAANAKTLHQLVPSLFVMWDKNIVPFARNYADFTAEMHGLGMRMVEESPFGSARRAREAHAGATRLQSAQDACQIFG